MQKVDLYQPFMAEKVGPAPLVLRVGVTPSVDHIQGGTAHGIVKAENYVLMSALPDELRQRVELAIQVLIAGR